MKIQCNVCEVAEAAVLCCADEAALCCACDERVHAANKLASKHQRVPLANSSSHMPKCDICQDSVGYFFCLEDRALLCRNCDLAIHSANPFVSSHQRFLLTGVRVGPESSEPGSSSLMERSPSVDKVSDADVRSIPKRSASIPAASQHDKVAPAETPVEVWTSGDCIQSRLPFTGGYGPAAGSLSQWHMDDFLGLNEFSQNFSYMDQGSSKADSGKMGGSDSSSYLRGSDDGLDPDERLGEVPDIGRSMPKIPSPPTASGLYWPSSHHDLPDSSLSVPDVGCSSPQHSHHHHRPRYALASKRRRQF